MTAQLIDGNALSKQLRGEVAQRAAALTAKGTKPGLAVVLVGDNPASQVYVRNKVKACEDAGFKSVLEKYEATLSEADLLARVEALNKDPSIHGILVQLPLPAHVDERGRRKRRESLLQFIGGDERIHGFRLPPAAWAATKQNLDGA